MDEEQLIECPNCQCLTAAGDFRPISIGAIYRHSRRLEKAQQLLIKSGHAQHSDGKLVPLDALFSDLKLNWTPIPPVLEQLHYNLHEIATHQVLQHKDTRVCASCCESFMDTEEAKHRHHVEQRQAAKRMRQQQQQQHTAARNSSETAAPQAKIFLRESDRARDFAFTTLQSSLRARDRVLEEKRRAREKFVEANTTTDIDWEGLPATAGREIRRIQTQHQQSQQQEVMLLTDGTTAASAMPAMIADDAFHSSASPARGCDPLHRALVISVPDGRPKTASSSTSPPRGGGSGARLGSARYHHSATLHAPLPSIASTPMTADEVNDIYLLTGVTVPISKDPMSSFDVSLQHRFMHELWTTMCGQLEFGSDDEYLYLTDVKGQYLKHQTEAAVDSSRADSAACAAAQRSSVGEAPFQAKAATHITPLTPSKRASAPFSDSIIQIASPVSSLPKRDEKVSVRHPFYLLYRKNQLRLPSPPVPLMLQKPNVVSSAANVEDALVRVDQQVMTNSRILQQRAVQSLLFSKDLLPDECSLLAEVVGDDTIELDEGDFGVFDVGADLDDIDEDIGTDEDEDYDDDQ